MIIPILGRSVSYSLKYLFPADVLKTRVEVLDSRLNVHQLVLVRTLDHAGLADSHVEGQFDAAVGVGVAQPARLAAVGRGSEADLMVAGLVGRKGKLAARGTLLCYDTVVVVEELLFAPWSVRSVSRVDHRCARTAGVVVNVHRQ